VYDGRFSHYFWVAHDFPFESLFYLAGLGGYIYALDETCDNILLNFPLHDPVVLLARVGYCFTLLFGLPLVTLPCREALCAIPAQMRAWRIDAALAKEFKEVDKRRKQGAHLVINGVDFDESVPFLVTEDPEKQHQTMLTYGARHNREHVIGSQDEADNDTEETSIDPGLQMQYSDDEEDQEKQTLENCIHFGSTFAVVGFCYMAAISVPGVGFVYSLCGSSMAILIAFIIPTSCYLKIRKHKRRNLRSVSAWVLLLISVVVAPVCTHQAIANS
jgi:amino acid permease